MPPAVTDAPEQSRFELHEDDRLLGFLDYRPAGKSVILAHTEVLEGNEGRGLGGVLVRGAVELLGQGDRTVIPTCPFAAAYLQRHPELGGHLDPSFRIKRS